MKYKGFQPDERVKEWCRILKIFPHNNSIAEFWKNPSPRRPQSEIRVIEQDVIRTRQDEEYFKAESTISLMKNALIAYCSYYNCEYMQGLNEIMAVIICIDQVKTDYQLIITKSHTCFVLFEKFVETLMPVIFSTKGVQALQIQLFHFHSLFCYHAPELWYLLEMEGMSIDIYATAWFVTLFSRRAPANVVLHLWDLLLQSNRPHLVLQIAVAFLIWNEKLLRSLNREMLPETLVRLSFQATEDVDEVFEFALQLEQSTPKSVLENIHRLGFDSSLPQSVRTDALAGLQQHRHPFLTVSADDVAAVIMGQTQIHPSPKKTESSVLTEADDDDDDYSGDREGEGNKQVSMMNHSNSFELPPPPPVMRATETSTSTPMRFLLLDCRAIHSRRFFIESSVSVTPEVVNELASVVHQQSSLLPATMVPSDADDGLGSPLAMGSGASAVDASILDFAPTVSIHGSGKRDGGRSGKEPPRTLLERVVERLSLAAASMLGLLWTCIGMDVHFAILEEDYYHAYLTRMQLQQQSQSQKSSPSIGSPLIVQSDAQSTPLTSSPIQFPSTGTPSTTPSTPPPPAPTPQLNSSQQPVLASRLAIALIRLGFSRVSVVRGEGLTSPPRTLPPSLREVGVGLTSCRDSISALAFRLWLRGSEVSSIGVLRIPEDPVLSHKARRFASQISLQTSTSMASKSTSVPVTTTGKRVSDNSLDSSGESNSSMSYLYKKFAINDPQSFLSKFGGSVVDPSLVTGIHEKWFTFSSPTKSVRTASSPSTDNLTSSNRTTSEKDDRGGQGQGQLSLDNIEKHEIIRQSISAETVIHNMQIQSHAQSIESGKSLLRSIQQGTMSMSTITDNMAVLHQRCSTLRSQLDMSMKSMSNVKAILNTKMV